MTAQSTRAKSWSFSTWAAILWLMSVVGAVGIAIIHNIALYTLTRWSNKPFYVLFDAILVAVGILVASYFYAGLVAWTAKDRAAILYLTNMFMVILLLWRTVLTVRVSIIQLADGILHSLPLRFFGEGLLWIYVGIEFFIVLALAKRFRTEDDLGINKGCLASVIWVLLFGFAVIGLDGRIW